MPITSTGTGRAYDNSNPTVAQVALYRRDFPSNIDSSNYLDYINSNPIEYLIDDTTVTKNGNIYIKSGGVDESFGRAGAVNFTISEDMRGFGGEISLGGFGDPSIGNSYSNDPLNIYLPKGWSADFTGGFNQSNSFLTNKYSYVDGGARQAYIKSRLSVKDESGVEQFTMYLTFWEVGNNLDFIREICFASGSQILLEDGRRVAVEDLKAGDMVVTKDHGPQPLRAALKSEVSAQTLAQFPARRPIRVKAGSFGDHQDCVVSPQHRVLVASDLADVLYDAPEVLVPAVHLLDSGKAEFVDDGKPVTYHHLVFDRHEIINGDGLWSESFQPGAYSYSHAQREVKRELDVLFPDLKVSGEAPFISARPSLSSREIEIINL